MRQRSPYSHGFLGALLNAALTFLYGAATASLYTFHSYRSGLATALHAAGVSDALIQLICRWMCPESLHVYRRVGTREHEASIRKAASVDVDVIQSVNAPKVSADAGFADLVSQLQGPRGMLAQKEFELTRSHAVRDTHAASCAQPPPRDRGPAPHEPYVGGMAPPLSAGACAFISRAYWPNEPCDEHKGAGWTVQIVSTTKHTALITFPRARAPSGAPFEPVRVQLRMLQQLSASDARPAAHNPPARPDTMGCAAHSDYRQPSRSSSRGLPDCSSPEGRLVEPPLATTAPMGSADDLSACGAADECLRSLPAAEGWPRREFRRTGRWRSPPRPPTPRLAPSLAVHGRASPCRPPAAPAARRRTAPPRDCASAERAPTAVARAPKEPVPLSTLGWDPRSPLASDAASPRIGRWLAAPRWPPPADFSPATRAAMRSPPAAPRRAASPAAGPSPPSFVLRPCTTQSPRPASSCRGRRDADLSSPPLLAAADAELPARVERQPPIDLARVVPWILAFALRRVEGMRAADLARLAMASRAIGCAGHADPLGMLQLDGRAHGWSACEAVAWSHVLDRLGFEPRLLPNERWIHCLHSLELLHGVVRGLVAATATITLALCDTSGWAREALAVESTDTLCIAGDGHLYLTPLRFEFDAVQVVQLSAGDAHMLALTRCGGVWSWGQGNYGQLGHREEMLMGYARGQRTSSRMCTSPRKGSLKPSHSEGVWLHAPLLVDTFRHDAGALLSAGGNHSLVVSTVGTVYAFGQGFNGQLGLGGACRVGGGPPNVFVPTRVESCAHARAVQVACGGAHSVLVLSYSNAALPRVLTCGRNDKGQLGIGTLADSPLPTLARFCHRDSRCARIVHVAAGAAHSAACDENGEGLDFVFMKECANSAVVPRTLLRCVSRATYYAGGMRHTGSWGSRRSRNLLMMSPHSPSTFQVLPLMSLAGPSIQSQCVQIAESLPGGVVHEAAWLRVWSSHHCHGTRTLC
ncbi:hypothetical protein AB1Y20_021465 [Prymnesium parvum]|uniref:Uncharacterized protein n=1 Tax=Prymnesium parvum TaxID=97485 RepID=A0AB34JMD4_PRYPA